MIGNSFKKLLITLCLLYNAEAHAQANFNTNKYNFDDNNYVNITSSKDENGVNFNIIEKVDIRDVGYIDCSDVPILIDKCLSGVCYQDTPFGRVFRHIISKNDKGNCLYKEVTARLGGMECEFAKDSLDKLGVLFDRVFFKFQNKDTKVSESDINILGSIFNRNCKPLRDTSQVALVKIDGKRIAKLANTIREANTSQANKEAAAITDAAYIKKNVEVSMSKINSLTSVVLSKSELDIIDSLINPAPTERLSPNEIGKLGSSLIFYLNSILFYGNDSWVIWLNNYKFIKGSTYPDIDILEVTPSQVKVSYTIKNINNIAPHWREQLEPVAENIYKSHDGNIKVEFFNENSVRIYFSLKPNQSFAVANMAIIEGKIA